jgi:hypothetical protein
MNNSRVIVLPSFYSVHFYSTDSAYRENVATGLVFNNASLQGYAAYEFDGTNVSVLMNDLIGSDLDPIPTVESVELEFYTSKTTGTFEIVSIPDDALPSNSGVTSLRDNIDTGTVLATVSPSSQSRTLTRVALTGAAVGVAGIFAFGVRAVEGSSGEFGGSSLVYGDGEEWRAASNEPQVPVKVRITFSDPVPNFASFEMYYTTADPLTAQSTPSNSVGGYKSINEIYPSGWLLSPIDLDDMSVSTDAIPTQSSGLVQIGPEIARYDDGLVLTRGVSPAASPSTIEPFPENVRFVNVSNLFDTQPAQGKDQYRCIAVMNNGLTTNNVRIGVVQNGDSNVQIDVGVEVPQTDSHVGIHTGGNASAVVVDNLSYAPGTVTGKYNGCVLRLVNDPSVMAVIDTFTFEGGVATITFEGSFSIDDGEMYCILPSPSQITTNDHDPPANGENFLGYTGEGSITVLLNDKSTVFSQFDVVYLWVKRTLTRNRDASDDTGATIYIRHSPTAAPGDYSSHILGVWDFDRNMADQYLTNDFDRSSGLNTYSLVSKYNLVSKSVESVYGLDIVEGASWYAGSDFQCRSGLNYNMSMNFWWYSPAPLGLMRHVITKETTSVMSPVIAKADSSISAGVETITAGEWVLCEVGVSETQNAMRFYICAGGTYPTFAIESEPYLPGLHNVNVLLFGHTGNGIASVEIDGKQASYSMTPVSTFGTAVPPHTTGQLRINSIGFGQTAHKTTQVGAIISELVLRSDFIDAGDSTRICRYGWNFAISPETAFDKFAYLGLGYEQPSTISTNMIVSSGSDLVVARSNGDILRGSRPIWDTEHDFEDSRILPLLKASDVRKVSIADSKLTVSGASIRIP